MAQTRLKRYSSSYRITMRTRTPDQWKSAYTTLCAYWRLYGGLSSFLTSPYLAISVVLTLLCSPYWTKDVKWAQHTIDIVPGLLGFSIGAFAIILAFSSKRVISIIAEDGSPTSLLMQTAAMFVHFIIFQTAALIFAVTSLAFSFLSAVGFFLLVYSLLMAIATCFALFNLAQLYNASSPNDEQ